MRKISIDASILQDETDKFLKAVADYREAMQKNAPLPISKKFERQASAVDMLLGTVVNALQSIQGATIIGILNAHNYSIRAYAWSVADFGNDPHGIKHRRFSSLIDRTYQAPGKKVANEQAEREKAKCILRECVEATVTYYTMAYKKSGMEVNPVMVEELLNKAYRFIAGEAGSVLPFSSGRRRGPELK